MSEQQFNLLVCQSLYTRGFNYPNPYATAVKAHPGVTEG